MVITGLKWHYCGLYQVLVIQYPPFFYQPGHLHLPSITFSVLCWIKTFSHIEHILYLMHVYIASYANTSQSGLPTIESNHKKQSIEGIYPVKCI